jgi:hypothetical protein
LESIRFECSDVFKSGVARSDLDSLLGELPTLSDPVARCFTILACRSLGASRGDLEDILDLADPIDATAVALVCALDPSQLGAGVGLVGPQTGRSRLRWEAVLWACSQAGLSYEGVSIEVEPGVSISMWKPSVELELSIGRSHSGISPGLLDALIAGRCSCLGFLGEKLSRVEGWRDRLLPVISSPQELPGFRASVLDAVASSLGPEDATWLAGQLRQESDETMLASTIGALKSSDYPELPRLIEEKGRASTEEVRGAVLKAAARKPDADLSDDLVSLMVEHIRAAKDPTVRADLILLVSVSNASDRHKLAIVGEGLKSREFPVLLQALNAAKKLGVTQELKANLEEVVESSAPAQLRQLAVEILERR